jgi:GNAT superfamily N-acetyltransferase
MALAHPIDLRYAIAADVPALLALVHQAYRGESSRAGWTTEADLLDGQRTDASELRSILGDPDACVLLATLVGEIVGSIVIRREGAIAHIGMFAVRPDLQAFGIGKRLLDEAEKRARLGFAVNRARMTVIEQRIELIAYYGRRGYVWTGQTAPFPYGNPRFGLPTRADLRFIVLEKNLAPSGS